MKNKSDLTKKKNQMGFKLALIKILSNPKVQLQSVSISPIENNINSITFNYYENDNSNSTK
jgi:hypothetical protein